MNHQDKLNEDLQTIFNRFIDIMKNTDGVMGAWNFGSLMHGAVDGFSDVDVVFLIDAPYFAQMEEYCAKMLGQLCDKVLLCWEEDFNNDRIVNNGYLLKQNDRIFQFDVFLLNSAHIDDYMCRLHYSELSPKDIIFDKNNAVSSLCSKNIRGELWSADIDRLVRTYLYHFNMCAKYLLRGDYFKLNGVMRILFDTHASLLLTAYDKITWGGMENKLHFIPEDKQEHLKRYYCADDFALNKNNLNCSFEWFEQDLREICALRSVEFDSSALEDIKGFFQKAVM